MEMEMEMEMDVEAGVASSSSSRSRSRPGGSGGVAGVVWGAVVSATETAWSWSSTLAMGSGWTWTGRGGAGRGGRTHGGVGYTKLELSALHDDDRADELRLNVDDAYLEELEMMEVGDL